MTKNIGFSPLIIGCMRFGTWGVNMSTRDLESLIEGCIELGLTDFDHADIYGHYTTENQFGEVLKQRKNLRQKIQITTKCGIKLVSENRPNHKIKSYDLSKNHILTSVDKSLENLQTDYIDFLLLHRPDYLMNPQEIAESFETLKSNGKVKNFGVSNFTTTQFEALNEFYPLITNQVEVSLANLNAFEDGTLIQCQKYKISPMAWSPLGQGKFFNRNSSNQNVKNVQKVGEELGEKYNASLDQILLAFLKKHPSGIIPVLGTTKMERIKSSLKALDIKLTHEEWYDLWQASKGEEVA